MPTVLLVEDNDDVREMMALALQIAGNRVVAAANGREALALLNHRPAPCLIILDLMMPVMSGWELRAVLEKDPALATIPVVVISALAEEMSDRMGSTEYLPKPVDIDRLVAVVLRHCQGCR